jgi:hypothetical protein
MSIFILSSAFLVVFTEVGALEISTLISGISDSINKDQKLINKVYKLALTTYASSLLAISGSYINKLIS